jgi:uncharacterized protein YndB with AHSA1/START domain
MATNVRHMPVLPEAIWRVLEDPDEYRHWVVGSKEVRDAQDSFPAPGTRFHHAVGIGPLTIRDHTEVVDAQRPVRLQLRAKARPLGTATVTMELLPDDDGTTVRMIEHPDGLYAPLRLNPFVHALTKVRNAESLRRLEQRVWVRTARRSA